MGNTVLRAMGSMGRFYKGGNRVRFVFLQDLTGYRLHGNRLQG